MPSTLYFPVFIWSVAILCTFLGLKFFNSNGYESQELGNRDFILPMLICLIYAIFLGLRPPWETIFGDTISYLIIYMNFDPSTTVLFDFREEWAWTFLIYLCKIFDLDAFTYFLIVSILYFVTCLWSVKILMPDNILLGFVFVLASLMFYSFAVNGIRNGLACHLVMLAIALYLSDRSLVAVVLCVLAVGIHRSTMIPIAAFFASHYFIKNVQASIAIWFTALLLSILMGNYFLELFSSFGIDDRMSSYASMKDEEYGENKFRWDFLLYSAAPLYMSWYICIKREIADTWYNVISNTYILANVFWLLVIRASYSNRFAYLSWFLYPIVIAYPLIMLPVWDDQDKKTALILFAYIIFTLVMNIFIWKNIKL